MRALTVGLARGPTVGVDRLVKLNCCSPLSIDSSLLRFAVLSLVLAFNGNDLKGAHQNWTVAVVGR